MKRRFAALLACALIAFGQRGSPPPPVVAPAPLVLDAVAVDAAGHPVADLRAEDFEVVQGGVSRKITNFTWFDTRLHTAVSRAELGCRRASGGGPQSRGFRSGARRCLAEDHELHLVRHAAAYGGFPGGATGGAGSAARRARGACPGIGGGGGRPGPARCVGARR